MGFMDKVKAAAKNADSKAGEEIDKGKLRSKIGDEKREIEKLDAKIGTTYYDSLKDGSDVTCELKTYCGEIDEHKAKIVEYEEEIKKVEEEGKKEREHNREVAEAASKKDSEEKSEE